MYNFIVILIVIVAVLLVLTVVVQNSKGGGLASGFASANQMMGVRKTTDLFEKITWWLAGMLVGLCMLAAVFLPKGRNSLEDSILREDIRGKTIPQKYHENPFPSSPDEFPGEE